jgi:hypothetical protein
LLQEFVELLCKARIERKGTTNESPSSSRSSEFRDVETKKMPREPAKETGAKSSGAGNPSAGGMPGMDSMFGGGRGGPNPFAGGNPFGGGGNPFSGGNPFAGQGRPGAGGFGGGGANMGAMGAILQKVMGNPQAMAFVQVYSHFSCFGHAEIRVAVLILCVYELNMVFSVLGRTP